MSVAHVHVHGSSHVVEYQIEMFIKYSTVSHFSILLAGTLSQALDYSWTLDSSVCATIQIFVCQIIGTQPNRDTSVWLVLL